MDTTELPLVLEKVLKFGNALSRLLKVLDFDNLVKNPLNPLVISKLNCECFFFSSTRVELLFIRLAMAD